MVDIRCVVDSRAALGESAIWDHRQEKLWWVDIQGQTLYRYDPQSGRNDGWDLGEEPGCLAVRESGGLVITLRSGFYFFDPETGTRTPIHDPEADKPRNRFNDGNTDRQGRLWAGTMPERGATPDGTFYRLDPDLRVTAMLDGFHVTNGTAFSPDGNILYVANTHRSVQTIWAFDYDRDNGTPHNQRVFFDCQAIDGRPDGAAIDSDGCYWFAAIDGWQVIRLTPNGIIDRVVDLPIERPTKPAFGGHNLDILYVTSLRLDLNPQRPQPQAGSLFAITGLTVRGLPETHFSG